MGLSAEQLAIRRTGVASSEVAAVLGLNPWRGPHDVFMEKTGREQPFERTSAVEWGTFVEPAIIELWRQRTDRKDDRSVRYTGRHQRTTVHPDKPLCIATPDGLVDNDACLEVKSYGFRLAHHWGRPNTDEIPDYYHCQTQWAMAALGRQKTYVLAEHEREVDEYVTLANPALFAEMYEHVERFWHDHVLRDVAPPIDGTESCMRWLKERYPEAAEKSAVVESSETVDNAARRLARLQRLAKNIARDIDRQKHLLMDHIGDNYGVETAYGKVLWYGCRPKTTYNGRELEMLARTLGASDEQLAALVKTGKPYRVLRAYWPEE